MPQAQYLYTQPNGLQYVSCMPAPGGDSMPAPQGLGTCTGTCHHLLGTPHILSTNMIRLCSLNIYKASSLLLCHLVLVLLISQTPQVTVIDGHNPTPS
jgi:hypothetical protein